MERSYRRKRRTLGLSGSCSRLRVALRVQRRASLFIHQVSGQDGSWTPPMGHILGTSIWEETGEIIALGWPGNTLGCHRRSWWKWPHDPGPRLGGGWWSARRKYLPAPIFRVTMESSTHCLCCILCSQSALAPSPIVVGLMHMGDVLSLHHDLRPAAQGHSKLERVDKLSRTCRKKRKKKSICSGWKIATHISN